MGKCFPLLGLLVTLTLVLMGCARPSPFGESRVEAQVDLEFSITPEKTRLLLGEPLKLQLRIANPSPAEVTGVFSFSPQSGLFRVFTGPAGSELQPYVTPLAQVSQVDVSTGPAVLTPGQSLEGAMTLSFDTGAADWLFPSSGSYQIQALLSIDPEDPDRVVESNLATVNVVQPAGADSQALSFIQANGLQPFLTVDAMAFPNLEASVPKLLELLDEFPANAYQPYVLEALAPLASTFPDLLLAPPTVQLEADALAGAPPFRVNFTAVAQENRGSIVEYYWDLDGDGQVDETTTEATLSHSFTEAGTYPVSVLAVDQINLAALDSRLIATTPGFHAGFEPLAFSLEPGQGREFRIAIVPMRRGLSAVEAQVTFNPQALQVMAVEPGDVLGKDPLVARAEADNSNGVVTIALARAGAALSPSPGGTLARITVMAPETAAPGLETTVEFWSIQIVDENLKLVPAAQVVYQGSLSTGIP